MSARSVYYNFPKHSNDLVQCRTHLLVILSTNLQIAIRRHPLRKDDEIAYINDFESRTALMKSVHVEEYARRHDAIVSQDPIDQEN